MHCVDRVKTISEEFKTFVKNTSSNTLTVYKLDNLMRSGVTAKEVIEIED